MTVVSEWNDVHHCTNLVCWNELLPVPFCQTIILPKSGPAQQVNTNLVTAFMYTYEKKFVCDLLDHTGIQLNVQEPWDIQVNDIRFYREAFRNGSLGLGEAYMAGFWDAQSPDSTLYRLLNANLETQMRPGLKMILHRLCQQLINSQSVKNVRRDIPDIMIWVTICLKRCWTSE